MKKKYLYLLDSIGPYTSALGVLLSSYFLLSFPSLPENWGIWRNLVSLVVVILYFFPLLLCTCMHRKYYIISLGGLGGMLGTIVGYLFFLMLAFPFGLSFRWLVHTGEITEEEAAQLQTIIFITHICCVTFFTFLFSWYFCRKLGKAHWREKFDAPSG